MATPNYGYEKRQKEIAKKKKKEEKLKTRADLKNQHDDPDNPSGNDDVDTDGDVDGDTDGDAKAEDDATKV